MPIARNFRLGRRDFLRMASASGLALGFGARPAAAQEDPANFHGMLMFGEEAVFFSHLPMFGGIDPDDRTNYRSPHRYQVILEVALTQEQRAVYARDRKAHPGARFYTISPEEMVLSHLFTPATAPQRTTFTCDISRDHFERGGQKVPDLQQAQVKIARVVHGRKFDPQAGNLPALEYLLFGRGKERFLAHAISKPPDFDHVLPVRSLSVELSDADLSKDVRIVVPDRKNNATERLQPGKRVEAMLRIGNGQPAKVQLEAGPQIS